jgi:hypothetical protein
MEENAMKNLLTVVFAAFALLVVPAVTMGQELNDSQEPGSVLVFPKFLRGAVTTEQGNLARTEIEISVTCPSGVTCVDNLGVILRAHWVCPGSIFPRRPAERPTLGWLRRFADHFISTLKA